MNIEEAIEQINKMLKIEKDCLHYDVCKQDIEAIETLLTAYEKEKEHNSKLIKALDTVNHEKGVFIEAYEKEKETNKQIKCKLDEKNIPIETLLAEFERLEDLEDDLTTVYLNGVYDGEKKVQDKIKAKIEEVKDGTYDAKIVLQSLLEKE